MRTAPLLTWPNAPKNGCSTLARMRALTCSNWSMIAPIAQYGVLPMEEEQALDKQLKMVQAWIEIHKDELFADWELALAGEQPFRIAPLQ